MTWLCWFQGLGVLVKLIFSRDHKLDGVLYLFVTGVIFFVGCWSAYIDLYSMPSLFLFAFFWLGPHLKAIGSFWCLGIFAICKLFLVCTFICKAALMLNRNLWHVFVQRIECWFSFGTGLVFMLSNFITFLTVNVWYKRNIYVLKGFNFLYV